MSIEFKKGLTGEISFGINGIPLHGKATKNEKRKKDIDREKEVW